jgi:hypothetical protein
MGLITNKTYVSKKTGLPIAGAYAKIGVLVKERNDSVRAVFDIHRTRADIDTYEPVDTVEVRFKWDRKQNIAVQAYEEAKKQTFPYYNEETKMVEEKQGVLFGWDNDIVEE